jgi:hypothetical protein
VRIVKEPIPKYPIGLLGLRSLVSHHIFKLYNQSFIIILYCFRCPPGIILLARGSADRAASGISLLVFVVEIFLGIVAGSPPRATIVGQILGVSQFVRCFV